MNQSKEAVCPNHDMPNCLCKALLENYKKELVEKVEALKLRRQNPDVAGTSWDWAMNEIITLITGK
jgi:hypothetical protein